MKSAFCFLVVVLLSLFVAPAFASAEANESGYIVTYSCAISPSSVSATAGSSIHLGLTCYANNGNSMSIVPCARVSWSSTIGAVSGSNTGATFNAQTTAGTGSISANGEIESKIFKCEVPATVNPGEAATISITPSSVSLKVGQTQQFSAKITDRYGNTVSGSASWSVSDPKLGSITHSGFFTANSAGSGSVRATYGNIDSTASVSITEPAPTYSCEISPSSVSIPVDSSAQIAATCYVHVHQVSTQVKCDHVSWSSTIGAISGDSNGAVFDSKTTAGTGKINANIAVSGNTAACSIPAVVTAGAPVSMKVSPSSASLSVGQTQQFSANLYDMYGNGIEYSGYFGWSVSNSNVGSISGSGLFTAISQGTATVKATYQALDASATVTVSPQPSNRYCEISPSNAKIVVMESQKFQARCFESPGGKVREFDCPSLKWSATNGIVSSPSVENGLQTVSFTAGKVSGSASLSARYDGMSAAEFIFCNNKIDLLPGEIAKVALSPSSAQLVVGDTLGFTAITTDEFGNKVEGARLFWSTSGGVGSINTNGLFTATNAGAGAVRADVSCVSNPEEGCPHGTAQIAVSNAVTPPGGSTGGSTGGSLTGGAAFSSSTTVSFTCAGAPATLAITLFSQTASVVADLRYMDSQPPTSVLFQNATGSKTFTFTPPSTGAYELRVSVGVEQRTTSFSVPTCTPSTSSQVQNITIELKPVTQPAIPTRPTQPSQGSQPKTGQQPAAAGKQSFFGIELPSDITALAAIGAVLAVVLLAASYFLVFGKKSESA